MNHQLLYEYIEQFLTQQKCHRHPIERAKLIKFIPTNLSDSFICAKCIEVDSKTPIISLKRALENMSNFINYDTLKKSTQDVLANLKSQLQEFYQSFNQLIESIEQKLKLRKEVQESFKKPYQKKIFELEKLINNYNTIKSLSKVDIQRQQNEQLYSDTLLNTLLILLQNEQLMTNCNYQKQQQIDDIFENSTTLVQNLLSDQYTQLNNLIEQENNLLSLITDTNKLQKTTKSCMNFNTTKGSFVSTFSSQISSAFQCDFHFKKDGVHSSFETLSDTLIHIPYNPEMKYQNMRLALIIPKIQVGPLKPIRQISFSIESQIKNAISFGICSMNQKDNEISLVSEMRPFIFFSSQGFVISVDNRKNLQRTISPQFNRGEIVTLVVNPNTCYIQLIKNYVFNQPFQVELQNPSEWQWTNIVFAIGVQTGGGADIQIIKE